MSAGPVIACAWLVRDALSWLENVFELAVQNFVVYHARLHVDNDCTSFEVDYFRTCTQVYATSFSGVYVSKEATQSFIVDMTFLLGVFTQSQLPESQPYLVSTLPHLHCHYFSRHFSL